MRHLQRTAATENDIQHDKTSLSTLYRVTLSCCRADQRAVALSATILVSSPETEAESSILLQNMPLGMQWQQPSARMFAVGVNMRVGAGPPYRTVGGAENKK